MDARRNPGFRRVALGVGMVVTAVASILAVSSRFDNDAASVARLLDDSSGPDLLAETLPAAPHRTPGAATPQEAVAQFLDLEEVDDWESSFELLSLRDRDDYLSAEQWATRRDGVIGSIESWDWVDPGDDTERTAPRDTERTAPRDTERTAPRETERTALRLTPSVSFTHGIKPVDVVVEWLVVDEAGWRVLLAESIVRPRLPPIESALTAARRWLDEECTQRSESAEFLNSRSVAAAEACQSGELAEDAAPSRPQGRAAAELTVRFGSSSVEMVLAVPLRTPADLFVIVAPGRDGWVVIDVLTDP